MVMILFSIPRGKFVNLGLRFLKSACFAREFVILFSCAVGLFVAYYIYYIIGS